MPAPRPLTIDLEGRTVKVYRNLNNGLFSVQYQGKVVAHLPEVRLTAVRFHVSEPARQRVLAQRCRNVHAYAIGTFTDQPQAAATQTLRYNPYTAGYFYWLSNSQPVTHTRALVLREGCAYGDPTTEIRAGLFS